VDVENWVEDKLDEGYSKEQLADYLSEKGYSDDTINRLLSNSQDSSSSIHNGYLIAGIVLFVLIGGAGLTWFLLAGDSTTSSDESMQRPKSNESSATSANRVSYYDDSFSGLRNISLNTEQETVEYTLRSRRNISAINGDVRAAINRTLLTGCGVASASFYNYEQIANNTMHQNVYDGQYTKYNGSTVTQNVSVPTDVFTDYAVTSMDISVVGQTGEELATCNVSGAGDVQTALSDSLVSS
jgi:hypothetical protein